MRLNTFLLVAVMLCGSFFGSAQTVNNSVPSVPTLIKGKGTLSFKVADKQFKTDSMQTKCWTSSTVPLAMLWAKGIGLSISWQIKNLQGKGSYKIDKDSKGSINFTINGKTYWIRKTDGSNYLNITITNIKDQFNVKLLSGNFEGIMEDKDGNKIIVKEGKFTTEGI